METITTILTMTAAVLGMALSLLAAVTGAARRVSRRRERTPA